MADKDTKAEATKKSADKEREEAQGQTQEEEATYHVDRLVAESYDFFGEPSHVVAGALSTEGNKKNFTLDEAKDLIKSWLKSEVELDNPQAGDPGREEG